jgi:hypothetical protein
MSVDTCDCTKCCLCGIKRCDRSKPELLFTEGTLYCCRRCFGKALLGVYEIACRFGGKLMDKPHNT